MRQLAHLAILAAAAISIGANDPKTDKDLIQGEWKLAAWERTREQDKDSKGFTIKFDSGKGFFIEEDDPCETCEFVVALFPDHDPKEIDFKYTGPDREDVGPGQDTMRGIYRLDGDTLVLCMGGGGDERPTEFKAVKEQEVDLMVLRRVR